jgi:hypothetical protein
VIEAPALQLLHLTERGQGRFNTINMPLEGRPKVLEISSTGPDLKGNIGQRQLGFFEAHAKTSHHFRRPASTRAGLTPCREKIPAQLSEAFLATSLQGHTESRRSQQSCLVGLLVSLLRSRPASPQRATFPASPH